MKTREEWLTKNANPAHEMVRELQAQNDALAAALRSLVVFNDASEDSDQFVAMAEDAAERGLSSTRYHAELIEDARAALARYVPELAPVAALAQVRS